jgi:hypothetical protein
MSARSVSANGMLMTKAGRTFCVTPKSTSQTSLRLGTRGFLLVKRTERRGSERRKIVFRQIVGHRKPLNDGVPQLPPFSFREMLDFFENVSDSLCHAEKNSSDSLCLQE